MRRGRLREDTREPGVQHETEPSSSLVGCPLPTMSKDPSRSAERLLAILAVRLLLASRKDGTDGTTP
jgi:hypothetical protein